MMPKCRMFVRCAFFHFEDREELVLTQFEKGIALATAHLFEIENILVNATAFSMSSTSMAT